MMHKLKFTTFKYGLILLITGLLIFIYSKTIFLLVDNIDIGKRFSSPESDLFMWIGIFQILTGLLYFLIHYKAKLHLIDKATIRSYWFTLPLIVMFLITPILDKYYPTSEYGDTTLSNIIIIYVIISFLLFFIGVYYFLINFIKSIYHFYIIKKKSKSSYINTNKS